MNQHKAKWEEGLEDLFLDIKNWAYGRKDPQQTHETMTQGNDKPVYQNIINNYTNENKTPLKTAKSITFGFMTMAKIVVLVLVIGLTIKVLMNPQLLINGIETVKQILHTI